MPENTVCVGRPTIWGNPFKVGNTYKFQQQDNGDYILAENLAMCYVRGERIKVRDNEHAVELYKKFISLNPIPNEYLLPLKGKNLACFCSLDKPCHADVLIEIVNNLK